MGGDTLGGWGLGKNKGKVMENFVKRRSFLLIFLRGFGILYFGNKDWGLLWRTANLLIK